MLRTCQMGPFYQVDGWDGTEFIIWVGGPYWWGVREASSKESKWVDIFVTDKWTFFALI